MQQHSDQAPYDWHDDDDAMSTVVQASTLIYPGRCKVHAVLASAVGVNPEVRVWDGANNGGDLKARQTPSSGVDSIFQPKKCWHHDVGLYVEILNGGCFVTVIWSPTPIRPPVPK